MAQIRNMTEGNPAKLFLLFSLPLMAGNVFQQLYTVVDTMVVGRVLGTSALAAVGTVDWFNWMFLAIITGLTQGFSILISQHYGAKKWDLLKRTVARSYILTAVIAALLLTVSQIFAHWILIFLNTPDNIIGMSLL